MGEPGTLGSGTGGRGARPGRTAGHPASRVASSSSAACRAARTSATSRLPWESRKSKARGTYTCFAVAGSQHRRRGRPLARSSIATVAPWLPTVSRNNRDTRGTLLSEVVVFGGAARAQGRLWNEPALPSLVGAFELLVPTLVPERRPRDPGLFPCLSDAQVGWPLGVRNEGRSEHSQNGFAIGL